MFDADTVSAMTAARRIRVTELVGDICEVARDLGGQTPAHVSVELSHHSAERVLKVGEHGLEIPVPSALTTTRPHADMKTINKISGCIAKTEKEKAEAAEVIQIHGQPTLAPLGRTVAVEKLWRAILGVTEYGKVIQFGMGKVLSGRRSDIADLANPLGFEMHHVGWLSVLMGDTDAVELRQGGCDVLEAIEPPGVVDALR